MGGGDKGDEFGAGNEAFSLSPDDDREELEEGAGEDAAASSFVDGGPASSCAGIDVFLSDEGLGVVATLCTFASTDLPHLTQKRALSKRGALQYLQFINKLRSIICNLLPEVYAYSQILSILEHARYHDYL